MAEISDEQSELWIDMLQDVSFEVGIKNIREHIGSSRYPPTIADIIRKDPNHFYDHEQLQLETEERFRLLKEWERNATDPPKELEMRWKQSE